VTIYVRVAACTVESSDNARMGNKWQVMPHGPIPRTAITW